jgi:hypothetical protein
MALKAALLLLAAVLPSSSASACQESSCKVEAPQDEVSLMQMKMEAVTGGDPVDLDNGKNALAAEVEAGKQELREYVEELKGHHAENSTDGACPTNWDMSIDANDALNQFLQMGCLTPQDPEKMSTGQTAELKACGKYNSASTKQGSFGFTQKATGTEETGGVCATKAYTVKCPLSSQCSKLAMYRAYSDPPAFSTKCPQWGGFWGAGNPTDMGAATYRKEYAICKKWNPDMNKVATGHLNNAACGAVVLIGNGEAVQPGVCGGSEAYDFSSYLQVVMCRRPSNCANFPMDVTVGNGFA